MADTTGYSFVSVPKQTNNQGRPNGKKNIVIVFNWDDVATYTRDAKGVRVTAFALATGKKPIGLFIDEATSEFSDTVEGDDYARGFIHNVKFAHPGVDLEVSEFKNGNVNENLGFIEVPCDPSISDCKQAGTPCTPLKMTKGDSTSSKEANKNEFEFKSTLRGAPLGVIAKTLVPVTDNDAINTYLGLAAAAGA